MKNTIFCCLVALCFSTSAYAGEDEYWKKALTQTEDDWSKAKEDYQAEMIFYYRNAYEFDLYDHKYNDLTLKVNLLTEHLKKTMPERLNESTQASWNVKHDDQVIELAHLKKQINSIKNIRDQVNVRLAKY